jgi:hypothetical protein
MIIYANLFNVNRTKTVTSVLVMIASVMVSYLNKEPFSLIFGDTTMLFGS